VCRDLKEEPAPSCETAPPLYLATSRRRFSLTDLVRKKHSSVQVKALTMTQAIKKGKRPVTKGDLNNVQNHNYYT